MPHLTLEYTHNITDVDFQAFFAELADRLVATGEAPRLGIKCRAVASTDYFVVNGEKNYKMVNLLFRLREGRSLETRQMLSKIGLEVLEKYFEKEILAKEIILSTEVKELITGLDLLKNAIR